MTDHANSPIPKGIQAAAGILAKGLKEESFLNGEVLPSQTKIDPVQAMSRQINNLCRSLSASVSEAGPGDDFQPADWLDQLEKYISNSYHRLLYSEISNYIFQLDDPQTSSFTSNLDRVVSEAYSRLSSDPNNSSLKKLFGTTVKFHDHVNLAIRQKALLSQNKEDSEKEIEKLVTPRLAELSKELTMQLIGLIGIFTALSFIVFGGISALSGIMDSLKAATENTNSVLPALITAIAWAFCLMNLLFAFMYFVIKIVVKKERNEANQPLVKRFSAIFVTNYVLLSLLLIFGFSWFCSQTGLGSTYYKGFLTSEYSFPVVWIVIMLVVIILGVLLGIFSWKKPQKNDSN